MDGYLLDRAKNLGRELASISGSGKSPGLNRFTFPEGTSFLCVFRKKDELNKGPFQVEQTKQMPSPVPNTR